jgi:hypothetical protein
MGFDWDRDVVRKESGRDNTAVIERWWLDGKWHAMLTKFGHIVDPQRHEVGS